MGPPIVRVATWLTHLELDWDSPVWGHWLRFLSDGRTLIRYDQRACGLSERSPREVSFDAWVTDLEAVVDAMGLERFPLFAMSQGASVAIEYAVRHPERLTHLVLFGGFAAGWQYGSDQLRARWTAMRELARMGWGDDNAAFRSIFAHLFVPEASPDAIRWYAELARRSCDQETAAAVIDVFGSIDVVQRMAEVRVPTLVIHAEREGMVPLAAGRVMAEGISGARFIGLDSCNHLLLEKEPAWDKFRAEFSKFVSHPTQPYASADFALLTGREREVLAGVALGLSNRQLAARFCISEKTVRNHVSNILDKLDVDSRSRAIVLAKDANFTG